VLSFFFKTVSSLGAIDVAVLLAVASGSLFAACQFHFRYRYFELEFAKTVYRDFYVLDRVTSSEHSP
jgi:hypothetical protein